MKQRCGEAEQVLMYEQLVGDETRRCRAKPSSKARFSVNLPLRTCGSRGEVKQGYFAWRATEKLLIARRIYHPNVSLWQVMPPLRKVGFGDVSHPSPSLKAKVELTLERLGPSTVQQLKSEQQRRAEPAHRSPPLLLPLEPAPSRRHGRESPRRWWRGWSRCWGVEERVCLQ